MTPWDKLLAVDWESMQTARAGELLLMLEDAGITHLLVIEAGQEEYSAAGARIGVAGAPCSAIARVAGAAG